MNFRVAPPSQDDCWMCEMPLDGRLVKARRGWVHLTCFQAEQR